MQKLNFRKTVLLVALINFLYFFVEFFSALNTRSVSLFADSIDFLEDGFLNLIIFFAISWSITTRVKIGYLISILLLIPSFAVFWGTWHQITGQKPPLGLNISLIGCGALIVNCCCALILVSFKNFSGSLTKAAFLSARNDVIANFSVIITGYLTIIYNTIWPDIITGLVIVFINAQASIKVYKAANSERKNYRL